MNIDPIVLMAYISVSINVITMIAACIAYAIFHVRKRRRRMPAGTTPSQHDGPVTPVFLQRYTFTSAAMVAPRSESQIALSGETPSSALAEVR